MARQATRFRASNDVAEGTRSFHFGKPAGFEFRAGQAIDLILPPAAAGAEEQVHAFSIISAPDEDEIAIATRMRDSSYKRALAALSVGAEVELDGPFGSLILHKKATRAAVLVAGGIGITPFMSMLRHASRHPSGQALLLVYSNRRPEDTAFLAELQHLQEVLPDFRMLATMTDIPQSTQAWSGRTGKVDGTFIRKAIEGLPDPVCYTSGPPGLVQAMRQVLVDAGIDEDDIRSEEFFGY